MCRYLRSARRLCETLKNIIKACLKNRVMLWNVTNFEHERRCIENRTCAENFWDKILYVVFRNKNISAKIKKNTSQTIFESILLFGNEILPLIDKLDCYTMKVVFDYISRLQMKRGKDWEELNFMGWNGVTSVVINLEHRPPGLYGIPKSVLHSSL